MIETPVAVEVYRQDMCVPVAILERPALIVPAGQFGTLDSLVIRHASYDRTVQQFCLRQRPTAWWQRRLIPAGGGQC
jgi:hypothetical protein